MPTPDLTTNFGINVNVNFAGVSYSNGIWYNAPTWTITPNKQPMPPVKTGNHNTITWNLHVAAVPPGFTAAFATPAVAFVAPPTWTGGAPANTNATTCVATDDFNGLQNEATFPYVITVVLTNGTVTQSFPSDPDVENQAGQVNTALVRVK